jgi:hypothetical protein
MEALFLLFVMGYDIMLVFIVDIVVLLLLLSRCALGYWAPRYHQLIIKRLLLLRWVQR